MGEEMEGGGIEGKMKELEEKRAVES